jgi:signal transduction histidine kinase
MFTLVDETGEVIVGGSGYAEGTQLSSQQLEELDPIVVAGSTVGWAVVPGGGFAPRGGEADFFRRVNNTMVLGAVLAFAVALGAGALAARSLTRPLRELTAATQAVASGDFERKVKVQSSDELGALAASFNRMSEALSESRRLRRQMTADIAHELRTPLSIILAHLDALEDGVLADPVEAARVVRDETERLSRLVEDLRTLTRADAGELALAKRPTEVGELLSRALHAYQPQAAARAISLTAQVEGGLPAIDADPDRLMQVFSNVLANALFHTPPGGRVLLTGSPSPSGVRISIENSGPSFAEDDLGRVFDRFYRSDKARRREDGGSGLGLAIARSIVEAHGGSIAAVNPADGGAAIVIDLPASGRSQGSGG